MYSVAVASDQLWSESNGPKKRGPKPKNEPAATVNLRRNDYADISETTATKSNCTTISSGSKRIIYQELGGMLLGMYFD